MADSKLASWVKETFNASPDYFDKKATDLSPAQQAWVMKDPKGYPRDDNPPSWVKDESTWERAKAEVRKQWSNYSEPWAVVVHVYEQMGGS